MEIQPYLTKLLGYDLWANHQLLNKFEKQFPQNPRIYELFSHMCSAQRIWLDRSLGITPTVERFINRLPQEIKADMHSYHDEWSNFIAQLQPNDFEKTVHYATSNGDVYDSKLSDIFMQVINHGTHHRGGIMMLMKEEGFVLPNIDYIVYSRKHG